MGHDSLKVLHVLIKENKKCTGNEVLGVLKKFFLDNPQQSTEVYAICDGLNLATNSLILLPLKGESISLLLNMSCLQTFLTNRDTMPFLSLAFNINNGFGPSVFWNLEPPYKKFDYLSGEISWRGPKPTWRGRRTQRRSAF